MDTLKELSGLRVTDLSRPEAWELRKQLSLQERWQLCNWMLENGAGPRAVQRIGNELPDRPRIRFWNMLVEEGGLSSPMFNAAPSVFQRPIVREIYSKYFRKKRAMYLPTHLTAHMPATDILAGLDKTDKALAKMWIDDSVSGEIRTAVKAQMLSARAAEKAVMNFYRGLGYFVEDIAAEQYWAKSDDYLTHDLLLNGEIPIDVKNTRSRWSPNANRDSTTYIEHIVPRFKQTRKLANVRIVGTFSPRLNIKAFERPKDRAVGEIIILGETDFPGMKQLLNQFQDATFSLKLVNKIPVSRGSSTWRHVLPVWLFNYPIKFRENLDKQLGFANVRALDDNQIPTPEMLGLIRENVALAVLLAARRELPHHWKKAIPTWQQQFFSELLGYRSELSMPVLFLSVLRHFTRSLANPPSDYDPGCYKRMLLLRLPRVTAFNMQSDISAGLLDPLRVIRSLCENLETIWRKQEQIQLWRFDSFHYGGLGILRGRKKADGTMVSLMAYCGGEVYYRGRQEKCGANLVLGDPGVNTCDRCGFLICPKCGFCSNNCSSKNHYRRW